MRELVRFFALCILIAPVLAQAHMAGESGASGVSTTCDSCHTGGTFSTTLAFTSPSTTVAPSSVTPYTLLFSNTASVANGVDVSATDAAGTARGTLGTVATTNGANLKVLNGEITHTTPKTTSGSTVSWDFKWTAPASPPVACYRLNACAEATNNDAVSSGDGPASCIVQKVTVDDGTAAAPTAVADTYAGSATLPLTITAGQSVLANDTSRCDPTAIKVTNPSYGTVTLNSDGTFTYTPGGIATSYSRDSFTYKVNDGVADSSAATVTINYSTPPSSPPGYNSGGYGGVSPAILVLFALAGFARRRLNRL